MAGVKDDSLVPLGPWPAGIDNVHAETGVVSNEDGLPAALREAENVDLDAQGWPQRRTGYVKRIDGAGVHSLWAHPLLSFGLFVDSGTLYAMPESGTPWVVRAGLAPRELSYELVSDRVVWSNGTQSGVVTLDGEDAEFGVEDPAGQPVVTATAGGGLAAGRYQVAITFRSATGEESGTGPAVQVVVGEGGGIALSSITQPQGTGVAFVRIYASPCNGDVLYAQRDIPVGVTALSIDAGRKGRPLETQHLERMPPGHIVRILNGRLFVAAGNQLVWSQPLRYGVFDPVDSHIGFARIDMMETIGDGTDGAGIYVADGKRVMWLAGGDPQAFGRRIADSYSAVPGSAARVPGSWFGLDSPAPVIYWLATDGVACLGLPGGAVVRLRADQVVAPAANYGATLVREAGGLRHVVTSFREIAPQSLAIQDCASAEVYRHGVRVS